MKRGEGSGERDTVANELHAKEEVVLQVAQEVGTAQQSLEH